ncbi:rCG28363 [Rattus norvegicus]|uniref:RCG28363 n=1 Tax=Rattus norvegicus TaxID=10116 RepID=A6IEW1_RAT|nr:rCG28363 [Rattus norvegicus]
MHPHALPLRRFRWFHYQHQSIQRSCLTRLFLHRMAGLIHLRWILVSFHSSNFIIIIIIIIIASCTG